MAITVRRVDYFHTTVRDEPGEGYKLFSRLADQGVNLLAFTAIPVGPMNTQVTLFPEESSRLQAAARDAGISLVGPQEALLVHGDDELGAAASIYERLFRAGVNVYASSGVTDGRGAFGYVLYVRPGEYSRAVDALGI